MISACCDSVAFADSRTETTWLGPNHPRAISPRRAALHGRYLPMARRGKWEWALL